MKIKEKDVFNGLLYLIVFLFIFGIIIDLNILRIDYSSGVSNGLPYCIYCPVIISNLIEPKEGDFVAYRESEYNGSAFVYTYLNHKFVKKENGIYTAYAKEFDQYDYFLEDDFIGTILFEWNLKTTDDFMESCLKELDDSRILDKIGECNYWKRERVNKD